MWSAAVLGTSQRKDGLVIGITTAGDQHSETLLDLYKSGMKAADGDAELERFGFFLWTAPENAPVTDPDAIRAANPSVAAGRIHIDQVISDLKTLPEHEARRYRLNQFISGTASSWIPGDIFRKQGGKVAPPQYQGVFAVDISKNWTHATVTFANENNGIHETEIVRTFTNPTEQQLFDYLTDLNSKFNPRAIALDDRQLPGLGKRLKMSGIPVWQLWTKEMSAACSAVYSMFTTNKARHANDPLLIVQSPNGVTKYTGETWLVSRKESQGDIDALMATIMSLYVSARAQNTQIGVF